MEEEMGSQNNRWEEVNKRWEEVDKRMEEEKKQRENERLQTLESMRTLQQQIQSMALKLMN